MPVQHLANIVSDKFYSYLSHSYSIQMDLLLSILFIKSELLCQDFTKTLIVDISGISPSSPLPSNLTTCMPDFINTSQLRLLCRLWS